MFEGQNIESEDTGPPKKESLIVAGYIMIIEVKLLSFSTTLESIIDGVLDDFLICKKPEAMGFSAAREGEGARILQIYRQGPDRVDETDRTEDDIAVHRTDWTEGNSSQTEERKKTFWCKKKYLILAISLISLLSIALTLGVSLYFGLYYGKQNSKGDYCKILKVYLNSSIIFLEIADLNNRTIPFFGKYFLNRRLREPVKVEKKCL